eukprot:7496420-Karenia_brevis.AAC.1
MGAAVASAVGSRLELARAMSRDRPFALGAVAAAAVRRRDRSLESLTPVTAAPYRAVGARPFLTRTAVRLLLAALQIVASLLRRSATTLNLAFCTVNLDLEQVLPAEKSIPNALVDLASQPPASPNAFRMRFASFSIEATVAAFWCASAALMS